MSEESSVSGESFSVLPSNRRGVLSQGVVERTRFYRIQTWTTVVTAVTAVVALVLAIMNYSQLHRQPTVQIAMPKVIRIAQGPYYTDLYIGPSFTTQGPTGAAGAISSIRAELQGPPGVSKPRFYWGGVVEFVQDPASYTVKTIYKSDPAPMVVTQDKPQQVFLRFTTVVPTFTVGRWQGSLITEIRGQSPLVAPFCIDITATDLQTIQHANGSSNFNFRNDQPAVGGPRPDCYKWAAHS